MCFFQKKLEGDVDAMCNLSKGVYDRAVDKTTAEHLRNMMDSTGWDLDKCMNVIKVPEDRKKVYKEVILGTVETV